MSARRREERRFETAPASDVIGDLLDDYGLADEVRRYRVITEWAEIVGPRVAARTWPSPIQDTILWVRVSNSSWLHQLSFMRSDMLHKVNDRLGEPHLITEVRLHLGRRAEPEVDEARARAAQRLRRKPLPRRPQPLPATGAHLAAIQAETASIEDDELRALITEARRKLNT